MVKRRPHRRAVLTGLAASALAPAFARAEQVIDLEWEDLLPKTPLHQTPVLRGLVDHPDTPLSSQQPASTGLRDDWNGQVVRLSGFVVPVDHRGTGVVAFILVPYVGACVHVPPPPSNQLVFVTTADPFESDGLFDAVTVTGMFGSAPVSTQLADIGYALSADRIEAYGG
ncbi:DUF3299 domain-containing protein [Actibacterium ureilyticum]|uniref:DUF3299 domain-containing protein n=1 Tax=Actibacterium ureilyticum TaxID=1590614 RepID=UPI000BAAC218|nr:DUF3299 domain-containing protein [Actibacterium ureilyticum]